VKDFIKPYEVYVEKYRMGLNPTEILPLYWHVIKKKIQLFQVLPAWVLHLI